MKDYTKVHDRQLFMAIIRAERAILDEQSRQGANVGFAAKVNVDKTVLQALRAASTQHDEVETLDPTNRRRIEDWKAPHPSLYLSKLQHKRKDRRMKAFRSKISRPGGAKLFHGADPYKNIFRNMSREDYDNYASNMKTVLRAQRKSKVAEAL